VIDIALTAVALFFIVVLYLIPLVVIWIAANVHRRCSEALHYVWRGKTVARVSTSLREVYKLRPFLWKPEDLLKEHGNRDFGSGNDRYSQWHKHGHLLVSPGRTIDPTVVANKVIELWQTYTVLGLAYDRWHIAYLLREFDRLGFAAWEDKGGDKPGSGLRLVPWGQGYKDMTPAIDALELEVIERHIEHPSNPVLNWNMANAVQTTDPAGNRKLDKDKARFRIDGAVALTMLCGLKSRDRKGCRGRYRGDACVRQGRAEHDRRRSAGC